MIIMEWKSRIMMERRRNMIMMEKRRRTVIIMEKRIKRGL